MEIKKHLDENNSKLLSELEKEYQIEFCAGNVDYCSAFTKNKMAIISYNPQKFENEGIAHELLHIWFRQFKCFMGIHIHLSCENHKKLGLVFIQRLTPNSAHLR